jgi:hypothetical protein
MFNDHTKALELFEAEKEGKSESTDGNIFLVLHR